MYRSPLTWKRRSRPVGSFAILLACVSVSSMANFDAWAQDATRGAHVFRKCAVCHTVDPAAPLELAPPLGGVIGRPAASIPGYDYSDSMRAAGSGGLVWTKQALMYFLDRPDTFMPGTHMTFAGLEIGERRDVIAYLETLGR